MLCIPCPNPQWLSRLTSMVLYDQKTRIKRHITLLAHSCTGQEHCQRRFAMMGCFVSLRAEAAGQAVKICSLPWVRSCGGMRCITEINISSEYRIQVSSNLNFRWPIPALASGCQAAPKERERRNKCSNRSFALSRPSTKNI